jgi:integrase
MAFFRKRKRGGKSLYYWCAKVPHREADGSIGWREVERGLGTGNIIEAREKAKLFEREYHDKLDRPLAEVGSAFIFAEAAATYMRNGGERKYLVPILEEIGLKPVAEIDQDVVQNLADKLYPGCAASTVNRQVFSPIIAVVNFAARQRKCAPPLLTRPRGHDKSPALTIPQEGWYGAVTSRLTPKVRALVLLLTLHGLRVSEALERTQDDLDAERWTLTVPDSKTGDAFLVRLSAPVIEAIKEMQREQQSNDAARVAKGKQPLPHRWLFGTNSRSNISRDVKKACKDAGLPAYGTHALGRHAFATRILRDGKSLAHLKEAGRWKTIKMPAQRYGHLEQSEVSDVVNDLAERWGEQQTEKRIVKLRKAE